MQLFSPSAFVTLAAVTSRFGGLPAVFANPAPAPATTTIIIDPLPPPIIGCPVTQLIRCCIIFDPLSQVGSSTTFALATSGVVISNASQIIGVGCLPFPLSTEQESIIGICEPRCCLREIPLADSTTGETIAINCLPIGGPIPGPILPIATPI